MTCFSSVWHLKSNERINFMEINLEFPNWLMIRKGIFNDFMSYQKSEIQNLLQLFLKNYATDRIKSDIYIFAEVSQAIKSSILLNTAAVKYLWKCNYNYNDLIYYILDMREFTLVLQSQNCVWIINYSFNELKHINNDKTYNNSKKRNLNVSFYVLKHI